MGLNAAAAGKGDKIIHAHYHGNLWQLLFALDVSLLFGVSTEVWFWLRLAWELPRSGGFCFGCELCHGCGAARQLLVLLTAPWSRVCFPLCLSASLAVQIASRKSSQHQGGGF